MFYGCGCLASLPNGVVLHSRVTDVSDMFRSCINLTALPEGFTIPEGVTSLLDMFLGCGALGSLPSGFSLPSTLTSLSFAFSGCNSLSGELVLPASISNMGSSFSFGGHARAEALPGRRNAGRRGRRGEVCPGGSLSGQHHDAGEELRVQPWQQQPAHAGAACSHDGCRGGLRSSALGVGGRGRRFGRKRYAGCGLVGGRGGRCRRPADGRRPLRRAADGDEATGSAEEAAESSEPGLSPHAFAAEGAPLYLMWPVARGARDARRMRGDRTVRVSRRDGDVRRTDAR